MMSTPLFDQILAPGESSKPSSVVKRRAIETQPVSPARKEDPDTAQEASNANGEIRGAIRVKVFQYLLSRGAEGATDYEIATALGMLRTSAGKRRKEIQELGHVEDSGMRRKTDTGSTGIVWKVKA